MTPEDLLHHLDLLLALDRKPTVPEVSPLVTAYYDLPGNAAGGSLHIVLDDGNLSDDDVLFCIGAAEEESDRPGELLGRVLLRMSRTQRRKLYARAGASTWGVL